VVDCLSGWAVSGVARECLAGELQGDEQTCSNINECMISYGGCDNRTVCYDTEPGYYCGKCPAGYQGSELISEGGCIAPGLLYVNADEDVFNADKSAQMTLDLNIPLTMLPLTEAAMARLAVSFQADISGGIGVRPARIIDIIFIQDKNNGTVHVSFTITPAASRTTVNGKVEPSPGYVAIKLAEALTNNSTLFQNGTSSDQPIALSSFVAVRCGIAFVLTICC
jgi:hypothetical protein